MAKDSSKVRVSVVGTISIEGTTPVAPTDADTALSGFTDMGHLGEAGYTESRSRSTTNIKNADGEVVRVVITESGATFKFVLLETKKEVIEAFYGATVSGTNGQVDVSPSSSGGRKKWVLDSVDGTDYIRHYVPEGEITEVGDTVYAAAGGQPIGYEMTLAAYPSSSLNGASFRKFIKSLETA